jgi:hypothetical protein
MYSLRKWAITLDERILIYDMVPYGSVDVCGKLNFGFYIWHRFHL